MGNRAAQEKHAIEQSLGAPEEPKTEVRPRRRRVDVRELYASWGGQDCRFYFLEAGASIGFRAQTIEQQAEVIGKKPLEFYDETRAKHERLLRKKPALAAFLEANELLPGGAARPTHARQLRVIKNPEKITDAHLDAIRRYRRVDAGMQKLRRESPLNYGVLELAFLPRRSERSEPKIERQFGQLRGLVLDGGPLVQAYEETAAGHKDPMPLLLWLEWRIDEMDKLLGQEKDDLLLDGKPAKLSEVMLAALEFAETSAIEAIRAFEAACAKPPEIAEAERDAAERENEPRRRRGGRPKDSIADLFEGSGYHS